MRTSESGRGDVDGESTSPRFSIAELFELLLELAQRRERVDQSRNLRPPCLRCLRRDMYGEGAESAGAGVAAAAQATSGTSGAPSVAADPGDRRYWSNVSPDSSWMDTNLPDRLPDPSLTPRNPGGTSGATRDEAAASSSTDTYHTSRASSPSPTRMPPARRFRDTLATNAAQTDPRPSTSRLSHGPTSSRDAQGHAAPTTTHVSSRHRSSHSASASAPFASTSAAATQPPAVTRVASAAPVSGAAAGTRLPQPAAANTPPAAPPPCAAPPIAAPPVAVAAQELGAPMQVWYVVTRGRRVGVFDNNSLVVWSVTGVRGNASRSFGTREEAERAFQEALDMGIVEEI